LGTQVKPGEHHGRLVARYRSYMGMTQQGLADEMRVSLQTVQRMEMQAVIKDPERRRLLVGLLGIPAAYLALDREEARPAAKTRLILNDDHMAFYEQQLETNWEVFHLGGTSRAERWIDTWVSNVADFAREARGTTWHKRSLAVLCMSYQLRADILGDQRNYIQANASCTQAFRIAQELDDPELKAAALVRQGVIYITLVRIMFKKRWGYCKDRSIPLRGMGM
jgi:transcriptional regulator with XRE-family HTH domain